MITQAKIKIYLFILEKGSGKEKHQSVAPTHPRTCPDWELNSLPLSVYRIILQPTETH